MNDYPRPYDGGAGIALDETVSAAVGIKTRRVWIRHHRDNREWATEHLRAILDHPAAFLWGMRPITDWSPRSSWEHMGIVIERLPEGVELRLGHRGGNDPNLMWRALVQTYESEPLGPVCFGDKPLEVVANAIVGWGRAKGGNHVVE